jgi:hypothetical protein
LAGSLAAGFKLSLPLPETLLPPVWAFGLFSQSIFFGPLFHLWRRWLGWGLRAHFLSADGANSVAKDLPPSFSPPTKSTL